MEKVFTAFSIFAILILASICSQNLIANEGLNERINEFEAILESNKKLTVKVEELSEDLRDFEERNADLFKAVIRRMVDKTVKSTHSPENVSVVIEPPPLRCPSGTKLSALIFLDFTASKKGNGKCLMRNKSQSILHNFRNQ